MDSFCIFLFIFFQRTILLQCFSVNLRNLLFREYNRVIHDTGGRYFHAVFCHPRDVFFFDSKIRQGTIQIQFLQQGTDLGCTVFCSHSTHDPCDLTEFFAVSFVGCLDDHRSQCGKSLTVNDVFQAACRMFHPVCQGNTGGVDHHRRWCLPG